MPSFFFLEKLKKKIYHYLVQFLKGTLRLHSHYILNSDQLDTDQIDPDQIDLHQIVFTLGLIWCRSRWSTSSCVHTMGNLIQIKLIWVKLIRIKFMLLQCEPNNSLNTNLIWISSMQIKWIWINLVHSVNTTWCGSLCSGSAWLLVWTQLIQINLIWIKLIQIKSLVWRRPKG